MASIEKPECRDRGVPGGPGLRRLGSRERTQGGTARSWNSPADVGGSFALRFAHPVEHACRVLVAEVRRAGRRTSVSFIESAAAADRTTRSISATAAAGSAEPLRACVGPRGVEGIDGSSRKWASPTVKRTRQRAAPALERATRSIRSDASTPTTSPSSPRSRASPSAASPRPQPTSSSRSPEPGRDALAARTSRSTRARRASRSDERSTSRAVDLVVRACDPVDVGVLVGADAWVVHSVVIVVAPSLRARGPDTPSDRRRPGNSSMSSIGGRGLPGCRS